MRQHPRGQAPASARQPGRQVSSAPLAKRRRAHGLQHRSDKRASSVRSWGHKYTASHRTARTVGRLDSMPRNKVPQPSAHRGWDRPDAH